ncbi:hypothetical protein VTK26DRAFT_1420 [Humicola hyalothermophila]
MISIPNMFPFFLLSVFASMAMAVPAPLDNTGKEVAPRRVVSGTPTHDAMAAVCTTGMPASKQVTAAEYPITNYTVITPTENWNSYAVQKEWSDKHFVSGPHYMAFTHKSDPYGAFKCQYTCNAAENCNAYFVWYEDVGTDNEHLNCVLFNAVIPQSVFVETNGTLATGAYDKLCDNGSD